jgi:glycosyltransferase involved in cell wall biosynthesis
MDAAGYGEDPYVLVVARLAPENNIELTLDALELLGGSAPRAIVVGTANFDSPIEARLRALDSAGRVRWVGHVDDQALLTELWANCSLYVHGHSVGGTNPALLQALGAGAPTLALDTPFNAEVLPDADSRYQNDPEELASKIQSVFSSEGRQSEMRERGQALVAEKYQWEDVCARYCSVLESLGAGR